MICFIYFAISNSLTVQINQIQYTGDSYEAIINDNSIEIATINSIIVQDGNFPVNSLSTQYNQLTILEVPTNSFTGSINDNLFKNMDLLKTVTINGATSIGQSSFENCPQLETVQFLSCTIIKSNSFKLCSLLTTVTIPLLQTIGDYSFQSTSLTTIEFNYLTEIGDYSFSDCSSLSSITAPLLESIGSYSFKGTSFTILTFENLTQMSFSGHCFESCDKLEIIQFNKIELLPQNCFLGCSSLHTIVGEKVTTINEYCFKGCSKLKTTTFPNLNSIEYYAFSGIPTILEVNFPTVLYIGASAYEQCIGLRTVVLTSCTTVREKAFFLCTSLTRVEIPELKTIYQCAFRKTMVETLEFLKLDTFNVGLIDGVSNVAGYFMDCSALKSFKAPLARAVYNRMFSYCSSLSSLSMDSAESIDHCGQLAFVDAPVLNSIGYQSFKYCNSLGNLTFPEINTIGSEAFVGNTNITSINLPSLTVIQDNAFNGCPNLINVSLEGCTFIGNHAFYNCMKLERIHLPNLVQLEPRAFAYAALTEIELNSLTIVTSYSIAGTTYGNQFDGCSLLTKVTMKNLTYIPYRMFRNCGQLTFVDAPIINSIEYESFVGCNSYNNITYPVINNIGSSAFKGSSGVISLELSSLTTIQDNAFNDCPNLINVSLEGCTFIGNHAFYNCMKLERIHLPNLVQLEPRAFAYAALTEIELNSLTIVTSYSIAGTTYGNQFDGCSLLTKVTMKNLTYIPYRMFRNCGQLTFVDAPIINSIEYESFAGCNSYNNITYPVLNSIATSAFYENTNITTINLSTVTSIDTYAFYNCPNLQKVSLESCTFINHCAFQKCSRLDQINLPKLEQLNPIAFSETALTEIELNSLHTASYYSIAGTTYGNQFDTCKSLRKVTMKSLTYVSRRMFVYCTSLIEINLPSSTEVHLEAFNGCAALIDVKLDSCFSMTSDCFKGCPNIKKISLGYQSIQFGLIPNPTQLTHISFPKATTVPENAFLNYIEMISCKLPLVSTIAASSFQGCLKLVELDIPLVVEFIGDNIFNNCENLESLTIRSLVTVDSSSANIFHGCRGLQYISLPDKPPKTFHRDTFKDLTCQVYIPPDSIQIYDDDTSIEGDVPSDHKWCGIELTEHDFIKIIGDEKEGIGITLFDACNDAGLNPSNIKNLKILSGYITQDVISLFKDTFESLNELTIHSNVSIESEKIPNKFLFNHQEIQIVSIFCSVRLIEESAFEGCLKLNSVICPNAKELKSRCFYGPTLLETISFNLVDTLTGSHFFSNNPLLSTIELPNLETATVIGYISQNSPLLRSVTLPEKPPIFTTGNFLLDVNPLLVGISNEAAIEYDASDNLDNDMKYYSLNLSYVLIICLIDGESKSGLNLKNILNEGDEIVEVIRGNIKDNNFNIPESIVSFTIDENVTLQSIPSNAFSQKVNLKEVNIFASNKFEIGEEAFSGCASLESAQIINATLLKGLAFKNCNKLKTVILNDVEVITGNFHFQGCYELNSVSFLSLTTLPRESSMIFLGCTQLTTIKLPSIPPKTFHKDTFSGLENTLTLSLIDESDYLTYDNDISIQNDKKNDGLWCGLILPSAIIYIKINQRNKIFNGMRLSECIASSGIPESSIITLEITRGILQVSALIETIKNLPFLENLIISKSVIYRGDFTNGLFSKLNLVSISMPTITIIPEEFFKDCVKLKEVVIDDVTKICSSAFKGCISLETVNLNAETFEGDSHFEGCTSLSSISIPNLLTVESTSSKIFFGCPLMSIYLPPTPPKTFHKDTFKGMSILIYGLTNDELRNYDSNVDVEDDLADDLKWCGIDLVQIYITVSINEQKAVNSSTFKSAAELSSVTVIKSIEIQQGMVKQSHLNELREFSELSRLVINENSILESYIIDADQFKDFTSLIQVKIMHNVSLMSNCFNGCTSLLSVEFKEVSLLSESSFKNCVSLNTIKIPNCKELRGDNIFSGCSNLRDIDLSSLLAVDVSASNIFEGCSQLTIIRLPSIEPLTFNKNTFVHCNEAKLILPNDSDYLLYDDASHVVDDVKEDEKWCGLKIDSQFLPPFLIYKINGIEFKSRKLINPQNQQEQEKQEEGLLEDNDLKTLELIGGLVDSNELKEMIGRNLLIEKFEANLGTLNEIASGTFTGCNLLTEITIHTEITISVGALQNIPSLLKLSMDLQQTIRNDDLLGDMNLEEINLPLLTTIPSNLFSNLVHLKTISLDTASLMHKECFKNCESLEKLELKNIRIIDGDSHFEGCSNLKMIDLSSLSTVHISSSRIFMNCSKLAEIKLAIEPPNQFNEFIFKNAGVIPNVSIPSENGWMNYVPQCTVDPDNNHYLWYGFDTGLVKEIINDHTECPTVNQSEFDCSCPEFNFPPTSEFTVLYTSSVSFSMDLTLSYVLKKSVSFSLAPSLSYFYFETYLDGELTIYQSLSYISSYLPYIIQFYSLTSSPSYRIIEIVNQKRKLTHEMLIGISCGAAAVFFIILACIILYCRQLRESQLYDLNDFSISDDDVVIKRNFIDNNNNDDENGKDHDKKEVTIIEPSEDSDEQMIRFWI